MTRLVALLLGLSCLGGCGTLAAPASEALAGGLPAPSAPPPPRPLQGVSGGSLGDGLPRAVLQLVPQGATIEASAGTVTAMAEPVVVGGAVVAAGGSVVLVCLTVNAATDGVETPVDIADAFYGTHFGDIPGWAQGCYAPRTPARTPEMKPAPEPSAPPAPQSAPEANSDRGEKKRLGRIYVTYTKFNAKTRRYYSGRTSMVIDLSKPLRRQALKAVETRDLNHHLGEIDENDEPKNPGFELALLDVFDVGAEVNYAMRYKDVAYWRIRGREQQLMDSFGGAQSDTHAPYRTENANRGVAKDNRLGRLFHDAATKKWDQLHPYTGN